ncbi:MAG: hypothetical protein JRG86_18770 [Deltaproteobacteria bacterium]|jgi:hypothetical protein|nr:hypothetical protein [Deltaproteobacteria bacterium]
MQASLPNVKDTGGPSEARPALQAVPPLVRKSRYRIREVDGVRQLTCLEAPTISIRIQPGATASAQEAQSAPPGTIFLDGAAQCAPFADAARRIYNLDHHEGCVRSFTLSACEQAMVLVRKGLELRNHEWTVRANDADLDAVLAIWVLLNHLRLSDPSDPVREEIMPLLRLEGAIDAQGLDLQDLCALPPALFEETHRRMSELRDRERSLKSGKGWQRVDMLEYVRERLIQIDSLVYPASILDGIVDIEELGRVEIGEGSVALACRTRAGIYEIERELRRLHGPRLGLIVLEQPSGAYTLRQVDPSLAGGLDAVYAHLNLVDAGAGSVRSGNRWGGSGEIGGSPRRSGSKLSTSEVLDVCGHALAPASFGRRLAGLVRAALTTTAVMLGTSGATLAAGLFFGTASHVAFGYALGAIAGLAFLLGAARARCVFGLRLPRGTDWIRTVPIAFVGALVGGVGIASRSLAEGSSVSGIEAALPWLAAIVGSELLFRGLVYGQLVWAFGPASTASTEREPRLAPAAFAALLSTAVGLLFASSSSPVVVTPENLSQTPLILAGCLTVGLAAGLARERSESVLGAIAVYGLSTLVVALPPLPSLG